MVMDVLDIAKTEAMMLGHQYAHHRSLEDVLVGELQSPVRSDLARLRLNGIIREYVHLPAVTVDRILALAWDDLEQAFASAQVLH